MPRREDEYWLRQHPPACTCVACTQKRLKRLRARSQPLPYRLAKLVRPLAWVVGVAALYGGMSFAFSFFGLLHPEEVQRSRALTVDAGLLYEFGGHFLFGLVVGAASRRLSLALLAGVAAILVDLDHVLFFLRLPVNPRSSHSLLFMMVSAVLVGAASARDARQRILVSVALMGALLSHLAFDALFDGGNVPLFVPLSYTRVALPAWMGGVLEAGAFLIVLAVAQALKRRPEEYRRP